jgi:WD40 repeat protein
LEEKNAIKALGHLTEARRYAEAISQPDFMELWALLYNYCSRQDLMDVIDIRTPSSSLKGDNAIYKKDLLVITSGQKLAFIKNFNTPVAGFVETKLANHPVALAISNSAEIAATLTQDGHLWLFNPINGAGMGQALAHNGPARAIAFSLDDRRLYTAGDDGSLKMWDTGHGYLDKGTPLLVRRISELPITGMALSPNGRLITVVDGVYEYRLSAEKISGPIRNYPIVFPGRSPYHLRSLMADPFNRYLLSSWEEGVFFHQLFDTDWRPDLSNLAGVVGALAISPDSRLWALSQADGRLVVGYAPQENCLEFLPLKSLDVGAVHYLHFMEDNAHLLAVGQNGLSIFFLDWNLSMPQSQGWDKKAELILGNFMARYLEPHYSETIYQSLKRDLTLAGMPSLDNNLIISRLKDAIGKSF